MITVKSEKKAHVFFDRNKEKKNPKNIWLLVTHIIKLLGITKTTRNEQWVGESGITCTGTGGSTLK